MLLTKSLALITAAAIGASASAALAQPARSAISWADIQTGKLPDNFATARTGKGAAGEWQVVDDKTVPSGRAFAQVSADKTDYRFPLAIYQGTAAANVDVTVRFKAVGGQVDRAGGIVVRLTDPDNYYVVRANALEDNVNFYRVVKGTRSQIKGISIKVSSDAWHTLGIQAEGDHFSVSFDGKPLFTVNDRTFTNAGKVALWTKADSVTHFDALTIRTLP
jgi:hypothetical protein